MTAPDPRAIAARLTDQMIAEGWIEHNGGPMPVDGDQAVSLKYRGAEAPALMGQRIPFARASRMDWSHDGGPDDIIAYRKEPTP